MRGVWTWWGLEGWTGISLYLTLFFCFPRNENVFTIKVNVVIPGLTPLPGVSVSEAAVPAVVGWSVALPPGGQRVGVQDDGGCVWLLLRLSQVISRPGPGLDSPEGVCDCGWTSHWPTWSGWSRPASCPG